MALGDAVAVALVVAHSACCGGSTHGSGSGAPPPPMVKVVSRGSGTLVGIESSAEGFNKPGIVATDGKVALVAVLDGLVRLPLDRDEPALRVVPGMVYDPASPISVASVAARPGSALRVTDAAGGRTLEVPGASAGITLAPLADGGLLRVAQDTAAGTMVVQRYSADGSRAHEASAPAPSASALPVASAARGDVAVVVFDDGGKTELWGVAVADGAVRWHQTVANRYTYGFTVTDGDAFVVTVADPASCEACSRAEIRRFADGGLAHSVRMGTSWQRDHILGAAGDVIWTFFYRPAGSDHMLGTFHDALILYEVFSTTNDTGKPIRTLADATGEWRALTDGVGVHALVPAPGGRVLALHVPRFDRAEAVLLSGPP